MGEIMNWFKENKIGVIIIYINVMFLMKMMKLCYRIQDFNYVLVTVLFIIGIGIYWFFHEYLQKRKYKIIAVLIIIAGAVAFTIARWNLVINYIMKNIVANFNNINDLLFSAQNTSFDLFKPFMITLLPVVTLIFMYLYTRGISEAVLVLNLSVMLMFWYLEYVEEIKANIVMFVTLSIITFALNNYIKSLRDLGKKGVHIVLESNKIISYILIYSLIIGWVGVLFPQEFQGKYSAETFKRWTNPFAPEAGGDPSKAAKEGRYGLSTSGYSNTEKKLGGSVQLNSDIVFKVDSDRAYHLKGDVKDYYTGFSWKKTNESFKKSSDIHSLPQNKFIDTLAKSMDMEIKKTMTIVPYQFTTTSMFVPNNTLTIKMQKSKLYYDVKGLTFTNSTKVVNDYTIDFYDPQVVEKAVTDKLGSANAAFNKSDYAKYLQVPDNISARTKQLVYDIVKDSRNDRQKVEKIKSYLSSHYKYSLEVSSVPEGQEFLEYFLFNEQKGYCVYFATAMTMFCRIAGIPARYVEGFKMPETSYNGEYTVTNEQAHAWSEYLLQSNPDIWAIADTSPTPAEDRASQTGTITGGDSEQAGGDPSLNIPTPTPKDMGEDVDTGGTLTDTGKTIPVQYIIAAALFVILLIYIVVRVILFFRKRKKILNSKSCIPVYEHLLKRLSLVGLQKSELITDMEYASSIWEKELRNKVVILVNKVYDEFYGGKYDEKYDVKDMYLTVENYVRARQNELIYLIRKFLI